MTTTASALADLLGSALADHGIPGGAVAISVDGDCSAATAGVVSADGGQPVDAATAFRAASLTKVMLASAIVRLAERTELSLKDRVRDHLPDFRLADEAAAEALTVADLLTHRGGWEGDFVDLETSGPDALSAHVARMDRLRQLVPPGRHLSYSNAGFAVLGRLLEVVSGREFDVAMRELVFAPLGMEATAVGQTPAGTRLSEGHTPDGTVVPTVARPRWAWPSGGVITTAADLVAFADEFARDRGVLVGDAARTDLMTRRADAVGAQNLGDDVALGWMACTRGGTLVVSHTGDILGQHSLMVAVPSAGACVATVVNAQNGDHAAEALCRTALAELAGLDLRSRPVAPPAGPQRCVGVSGSYETTLSFVELTVSDDARVEMVVERKPLLPGTEGTFRSSGTLGQDDVVELTEGDAAGSRVRVIREADDRPRLLRVEGRLATPRRATEPPERNAA
jgi:CubicO group peptidase (beta-lactamase class C family)